MWFIYSLIGSISLVLLNTLSKLLFINAVNIYTLGILSVFTTYCFWVAWQTSTWSFLGVWFVQSSLVSIGGLFANKYIIRQPLLTNEAIGIGMILLGAFLLKK